jgi:amino acid adenylation domain-containing protein
MKDNQMMFKNRPLSCFVIGEGSLLIQCATRLLEREYQIFCIVSPDESVIDWAKSKDIAYRQSTDNLLAFFNHKPFDYLFSIVNTSILSKEILELPRQYAINYHDALLPKYAGINATSWAIINQEKTHGVTWHIMSEQVDGGDILKQTTVEIAKNETAFTLNAKCYEAAISSFLQLITELSCGQVVATQQNLENRTYFSRSRQSSGGGLLSWNHDAQEIDALIRGLDFGPYPNPLGLAKFVIGSDVIIIPQIEVTDSLSTLPPGTITAICDNVINVSTTSYDVALRQVMTIEGQTLSIADFITQFGIHEGYRFEEINSEKAKQIEIFYAKLVKYERFWVNRLATLQPLTIPYVNRMGLSPSTFKMIKTSIPHEITNFACHSGWKTSDFLWVAFVGYLARIGDNSTFDIGLRVAKFAGLESFFASHVPCRLTVEKEKSFDEVFSAVQEQIALSKRHKTYSHDIVVRYPTLRPAHELRSYLVIIEKVDKLENDKVEQGNDLTFIIQEDGKKCAWFYDNAVLASDSMARIVAQFRIFMQGILTQNAKSLAELPLLSGEERHKILVEWNNTQSHYKKNVCIHQLFEAQVEKTPEAVAVVFEAQQLTYRELNNQANQLAHHLQALGVKPEVLVGICIERSLEMIIGLLGILKAGGAYLPLDPAYPTARLAFMLEDAGVGVLLTQSSLVEQMQFHQAHVVCLDTEGDKFLQFSSDNLVSGTSPSNLAYVIYTSGSTGKPKGVLIEHRGLCNLTNALIQIFGVQIGSRVLQFSSLSFDAATADIVIALCSGATLYLVSQEIVTSPSALIQELGDQSITLLKIPASVLGHFSAHQLPALHTLSVGGDICSPEVVAQWSKDRRFFNAYGPTESTICATVFEYTGGYHKLPIGRPIANTQVYILDQNLQPTPIGVLGELHISGVGLSRGYLNHPELTAKKFIPNPFSSESNSRLYKTGDLARYLPDGNIEFLGRLDNQVKIRGFRIELGEIETVLSQHPTVQESVVIVHESESSDKRLVAYLVSNPAQIIDTIELRSFLKERLPEYMIPSALVQLEAMPLTPTGKVDRRALPPPDQTRYDLEKSFVAPRSPVEERLASIWTEVLHREPIGIYDNFFELGGHSLQATQIISRISEAFAVELSLRSLFETPTVVGLAEKITQQLIVADDDMAELLAELEGVSEEEAQRLLATAFT